MELALDQADVFRIQASLAHTANRFEDEATRRQARAAALLSEPCGLLGAVIYSTIAELCCEEAQQLRALSDRITAASGPDGRGESAPRSPFG